MNSLSRCAIVVSVAVLSLSGCGARVEPATEPSGAATGGAPSLLSASGGTGGVSSNSGPDPTYCGGILVGPFCGYHHYDSDTGALTCDMALSTPVWAPEKMVVLIDCVPQLHAADAAENEGFIVDFSLDPAHLVLLGDTCETALSPGKHAIDLVLGCQCVC